MKVLLASLVLFLTASSAYAQEQVQPLPVQQADVAVKLFQKACLINYGRTEKAATLLDKYFPRQTVEQAGPLLKQLGANKGVAWTVDFPQGNYTIVQEPSGNCHVTTGKADSAALHADIKAMAAAAFKDLPNYTVDYQAVQKDKDAVREASGFNLNGFGGDPLLMVKAFTVNEPASGQPGIIISLSPKMTPQ